MTLLMDYDLLLMFIVHTLQYVIW